MNRASFSKALLKSNITLHSNRTLKSSINEDTGVLEMSYNTDTNTSSSAAAAAVNSGNDGGGNDNGGGDALTAEEQEEVNNLPKSTWSTFVSPAERKRRQKLKLEEMERKRAVAMSTQDSAIKLVAHQDQEAKERSLAPPPLTPSNAPPLGDSHHEDGRSESSESLTEEEKERAADIAKTSFVSPAERKRRQLARLQQEQQSAGQQAAGEGGSERGSDGEGSPNRRQTSTSAVVHPTNAAVISSTSAVVHPIIPPQDQDQEEEDDASNPNPNPFALPPAEHMAATVGTAHDDSDSQGDVDAEADGEEGDDTPGTTPVVPSGSAFPVEAHRQKQKRASIQNVLRDTSLSPQERNSAIQKIIKGEFEDEPPKQNDSAALAATKASLGEGSARGLKHLTDSDINSSVNSGLDDRSGIDEVAIVDGKNDKGEVPLMDSSSDSESGEEEEESSSGEEASSSGEEESSEEESGSEEEGGEWASSSSYETDSEDESKVSSKVQAAATVASAASNDGGELTGGEAMLTDMPDEDNAALAKRKAIQAAMQDRSLSAHERNKKIQDIMAGKVELERDVPAAPSSERDLHLSALSSELLDAESESSSYRKPRRRPSALERADSITSIPERPTEGQQMAMSVALVGRRATSNLDYSQSSTPLTEEEEEEPKAQAAVATASAASIARKERVRRLEAAMANAESAVSSPLPEEDEPSAQAAVAVAAASAASIAQKERVRQLEAQLDQELANHAALEQEAEVQLTREVHTAATLERSAEAQLEAQLDAELQHHAEMEREQQARELEFQKRAAAEEEERSRVRALEEEHHRVRALALAEEQQRRRKVEEDRRAEQMSLAREKEHRRIQEEREREERRIQDLRKEMEREERRIQDLREERERQEAQHRVADEQRILREEQEREQRRLQGDREREQQRLRVLQEERERQQRLAQEEQRRLEGEQRRLQEEREREERRLQEQRDLHQRLERERMQRSREQEAQRHQQEEQEIQVTRAIAPRSNPSRIGGRDRSLRASQTLATRQGDSLSAPNDNMQPTMTYGTTFASMRPPPQSNIQRQQQPPRNSRYDGVEDDELNWRLDSYASLSDYTIVVNRANLGPYAPDFDTVDVSGIDFVLDPSSTSPKSDVYYVHKAMIAVGSRRSELLGRRIREAENSSRGANHPDGHSSDINTHETVLLESAANAMGMVLDFLYYPDRPLDINVENAVPLVYLGKRYKIRALLEQAEVYVMDNIESATAMYFLLDSYLYRLEDILGRAIDVTASNLAETVDFEPIYKLPPELFRRVILSKELQCDSELLSLIVYSYCGEHHAEDIDVEYFRELTKPRIMQDIDPKVALMVLKFYVDLILDDDENCDIMEVLQGDSLRNRCVTVIAKHWQGEVCDPMLIDAEWDNHPTPSSIRHPSSHESAALHRSLPPELQNYLLEKCILEAKNDVDSEKAVVQNFEGTKSVEVENNAKNFGKIVKELQAELEKAKRAQGREVEDYRNTIEQLQLRAMSVESELDQKKKALEEYEQELKRFRRVPGIHNFGEVSKDDPKIIDKTTCTYSANPEHHYPNHRRGDRRPTQMPSKGQELGNLGKENGYLYDDGKGGLLPVFYYNKRSGGKGGDSAGEL